ncbi:malto-oligosyltrehalose synthase [Persicimonas caeni]|uniref:Malto-oligosyltrehalose synthase n=1 Tax=Persicimonas caeni TaxID=2292766 RepID=A0A4Y6Q268_PERCE|nr:malto-oligosyltrehalose synthase [Persicimonas caeni]QDG54698.1 malto-oligosyltrehalose synthase [Persicimonas caeni]QED35919.1 malto-oligosyltrehalose synthase [Persicimonas caeni]
MRIPASTYRVQLGPDFGFRDAEALVPYLDALGVSDLYLSPILAPREGSTHGYDVADPSRLNPVLGTRGDFDSLSQTLREHQMGLLLDIVPNHMAASPQNPWWADVLARGQRSEYADFFDIEWAPPWPNGSEKLLIPVLGDHYAEVLERGELQLAQTEDGYVVQYFDNVFPLSPETSEELDANRIEALNSDPEALDAVLDEQHYSLRYWKSERYELNYRRFFNISDLAGLRVERPRVRHELHELIGHLWEERGVTGLRVDHIDGLREPKAYLDWLRRTFRGPGDSNPYVLVEKILAPHERLPDDWPVAGTTGYDYLNKLNGVFVDPDGHRKLAEVYARFTGRSEAFRTVVYEKKRFVLEWLFQAELELMRRDLVTLASKMRRGRDLTAREVGDALAEVSSCLSVYRTYTRGARVAERDREHIEQAVDTARSYRPQLDSAAYDFVERVLLLEVPERLLEEAFEFVQTWQQFTPPLMAKGLEDTSLYVYNHLISLNTVGGEPDEADVSLSEFHAFNEERSQKWPGAMNSTSTHDSKRGEDVRNRIDVLSEMPEAFERRLTQWAEWNEPKKISPEIAEPPSRNEEMLLYQTLLGSWPLDESELDSFPGRLREYLVKSAREAKEQTSWHDTDEGHEYALVRFAERILDDSGPNPFLEDFLEIQEELAFFGALNSLSQVVLKVASPGVPDIYQGSERWNLTLVDPDNRRPVDFDRLYDTLHEMQDVPAEHRSAYAVSLLRDWKDARIKQFVTWRALSLRRQRPSLFIHGDYRPLYGRQKARPYVCAFVRRHEGSHVIAVAPRRLSRRVDPFELPVGSVWENDCLRLPSDLPSRWTNALTGEVVEAVDRPECGLALEEVFATLPVALLEATE